MAELHDKMKELTNKTIDNNLWRQRRCFNLIPSETTPSLLTKMCEISDPAGRYAEHRTMGGKEVYFYQGIDFIRDVEQKAVEEMKTFFDSKQAEMRPVSGQMANEVVFKAILKYLNLKEKGPFRRISKVMNNELTKGGHLSSQPMGALFNYVESDPATGKENVVNFPLSKENIYKTDTSKLSDLIMQHKPELIIFGKSLFLHAEPVKEVAGIIEGMKPKPIVMYDMAHVLGLYGLFQEPLKEGADIVTGSTHKTFFGPQRGVIACNIVKGHPMGKLWPQLKSRAFPGSTSNHHPGTLLALLVAAMEMNAYKAEYQSQVRKNARAFAKALVKKGIEVEGDPGLGYTETHQVVLRVRKYGIGEDIAMRLEKNNIVCNYQALPDDESFIKSSGLRMGVQEMTRFGMKEEDFEKLAEFTAAVIIKNESAADEVSQYRQNFLDMQYCLPEDQALKLGASILSSVFPKSDQVKRFAEAMHKSN